MSECLAHALADGGGWLPVANDLEAEWQRSREAYASLLQSFPTSTRYPDAVKLLTVHAPSPFPVGRKCDLLADLPESEGSKHDLKALGWSAELRADMRHLMPFTGNEQAAFIVRTVSGGSVQYVCMLVDSQRTLRRFGTEAGALVWPIAGTPAGVKRCVVGDPEDEKLAGMYEAAKALWESQSTGRPATVTDLEIFEAVVTVLGKPSIRHKYNDKQYVSDRLGLTARAVELRMNALGISWNEFCESARVYQLAKK